MSLKDVVKLEKFTLEIQARDLIKAESFTQPRSCAVSVAAKRQLGVKHVVELVDWLEIENSIGGVKACFTHEDYDVEMYEKDKLKALKVKEKGEELSKVIRKIVMKRAR